MGSAAEAPRQQAEATRRALLDVPDTLLAFTSLGRLDAEQGGFAESRVASEEAAAGQHV